MCLSTKTGAVVADQHCLETGKKPQDSVKPCHTRCKLRYVGVMNNEGQLHHDLLRNACIQGVLTARTVISGVEVIHVTL